MKIKLRYFCVLSFIFFYGCGIFSPIRKTKTETTETKTIKIDTVIFIEPKKDIQKDFIKLENFLNYDTLKIENEKTETKIYLNKTFSRNTIIAETREKGFFVPIIINEKIQKVSKIVEKKKQKINTKEIVFWVFIILFGSLMIKHIYNIIKLYVRNS